MSTYCYTTESGGGLQEHEFPIGKAPQRIRNCKHKYKWIWLYRNIGAEAGQKDAKTMAKTEPMPDPTPERARRRRRRAKLWPLQAEMSGVLSSQVPEVQKLLAKSGVTCDFDKHGEPKWRSQRHQDSYCRAMGLFNKQSVTASPRNK